MKSVNQRIAEALGVARGPGRRRGGPARRRLDRAVHRPLPQGSHRRARRRAAAHPRGAAALPARARGAARGDPRQRRASRASSTTSCRRQLDGGRHQGAARGPLPALQAQAPHQGADRARGRPRSRWPRRCSPTRRGDPKRRAAAFVDADKGVADVDGRARGRARHPRRALRRGRRPVGALREEFWTRGRLRLQGARGQGGRRAPSSPTTSTSPSR